MVGRQFTWANNLPEPTYEKLDRVLMDSVWEFKLPLVSVRALPQSKALSNHAPILLTTRAPLPQHRRQFKFELGWIYRDGFADMIKFIWDKTVAGNTPIQRWNNKLYSVCIYLGGWARHMTGQLKQEKLSLTSYIDDLETIAEV
jgi:hypothetical protein